MESPNLKIAMHWLDVAYGKINTSIDDLNCFIQTLDSDGFDSWEKKRILVKNIRTHYTGHDKSEDYIKDYMEQKAKGSPFPAIIVKLLSDESYFTIDGYHRVIAAQRMNEKYIEAFVGSAQLETKEIRKENFKKKFNKDYFFEYYPRNEEDQYKAYELMQNYIENNYTDEWYGINKISFFISFKEKILDID